MASTKILNAVAKGVSSAVQGISGNSFVVRCDSGSLDVVLEGVVYASLEPKDAEVFTVSSGDTVVLTATGDNTSAWLGEV